MSPGGFPMSNEGAAQGAPQWVVSPAFAGPSDQPRGKSDPPPEGASRRSSGYPHGWGDVPHRLTTGDVRAAGR
jgi:hypothetical protein